MTIDLGKEVSATALKVQASQPVDVYYYSSGRQLMTVLLLLGPNALGASLSVRIILRK
ncbi:hypothetical protein [Paenibacillus sp. 32O-W]|uniref:hypothetical protein n=1 Tax=Paenibacillus sp. 32O-W TaxID=1695218 RepID=UPI001C92EF03|nr:hypothetical protein [Paenibacillus sp. 32O-W]